MSSLRLLLIFWVVLSLGAQGAVTCTVLANFGATPNGVNPSRLVEGADGNYYGTAQTGGTHGFGAIFQMTPAGAVTTLYSFTGGNDGKTPTGRLALGAGANAGTLFGTTSAGGAHGFGTFFSISTGGTFTLLHAFNGASEGMAAPAFVVTGNDGKFYATTAGDSTGSTGSVFLQLTGTGAVNVLHTFTSATDGGLVNPQIVQGSDGAFYGSSELGGTTGFGSIFRITTGGAFSVISNNASAADQPVLTALGPAPGNLVYGTNGANGEDGSLFSLTTTGTRTIVKQFSLNNYEDGLTPDALVLGTDGNFYGFTQGGGTAFLGGFFQLKPNGTYTVLHSFATVGEIENALTPGSDGFLYADDATGGSAGGGSIVKLSTTGTITPLVTFGTPASFPVAGLIQAADGNFYGTTSNGGPTGDGTLFAMSPAGTLLTLASFNSATTGAHPQYPLVQDPATGTIYGATLGTSDVYMGLPGTYFHVPVPALNFAHASDPVNQVTITLDTTPSLSTAPNPAGLLLGTPPNGLAYQPFKFGATTVATAPTFFTTTVTGGANGGGSLLARGANGAYTTLYSFPNNAGSTGQGCQPAAPLLYDAAGNLYGTASSGGANGDGTIFKITPSVSGGASTITDVYNFTDSNSSPTTNNLAINNAGTIYGTMTNGGRNHVGFVYSLTSAGTFTVVHNFDNTVILGNGPNEYTDGASPNAGLTLGADGNLYGTTTGGSVGTQNNGVFYSISPTGTYTILYSFALTDGTFPVGKLVQGVDGAFYGVMQSGGLYGYGTIYRLNIASGTTAQTITFPAIADQVITNTSVTLAATASSGLPITYLVSGPVTLGGTNNNVLTFTGTGTVSVTAGQAGNSTFSPATSVTRTFAITAMAGQTVNFATWESGFGVSSGPSATPFGDSTPNLLKYVFDIDPSGPMAPADRAALPKVGMDTTTTPGTTYLTLSYREYNLTTGVHVNLQTSTDLVTWSPITPDMTQTISQTVNDTTVKQFFSTQGAPRKFVRVNVTMP